MTDNRRILQFPPHDGMSADAMWSYLSDMCVTFVFNEMQSQSMNRSSLPHERNNTIPINKSFARVVVYAKYGPGFLDGTGAVKIKSGNRGACLLSHELKQLFDEEERSLLCEIYSGGDGITFPKTGLPQSTEKSFNVKTFNAAVFAQSSLSSSAAMCSMQSGDNVGVSGVRNMRSRRATEQCLPPSVNSLVAPNVTVQSLRDSVVGCVMNQRNPLCYQAATISIHELRSILSQGSFPHREKDERSIQWSTIADAMSNCLLVERQRRINALKCTVPLLNSIRRDPRVINREAVFFYSRSHPKPRSIRRYESPQDTLVALHRNAFQISDISLPNEVGNNHVNVKPSASQLNNNVKCLRPDFEANHARPGWNGACCLVGVNGGPTKVSLISSGHHHEL